MQRQIQQDLLPLIGPGYKDVEQNLHFLNKTAFEPSREILVLFVLRKHSANAHAQPSSGARCVIFGLTLRLLPYFMCANSEGSGETARMHRLA